MPADESTGPGVRGDSLDELFSALAVERRRRALRYFRERDADVADVADIAEHVCSDDEDPEATALALHHVDLPKLAASNVLEYDPASNTVRYRGGDRLDAIWRGSIGVASSAECPPPGDRE